MMKFWCKFVKRPIMPSQKSGESQRKARLVVKHDHDDDHNDPDRKYTFYNKK